MERLAALGLIDRPTQTVKLLGDGTISKRVTILVHRASESAKTKIAKAGGSVELITTGASHG